MTGDIFSSWLNIFNRKWCLDNRHVTLIIDNCPAHVMVSGLSNKELFFLPPGTTSRTQWMDMGVIANSIIDLKLCNIYG